MTNINLYSGSGSNEHSDTSMESSVIQERLRQARLSFNAALVLTVISAGVSLVGVALLIAGRVPEGIATTSGALASNVVSLRNLELTKDTNDRLDKTAENLDDKDE